MCQDEFKVPTVMECGRTRSGRVFFELGVDTSHSSTYSRHRRSSPIPVPIAGGRRSRGLGSHSRRATAMSEMGSGYPSRKRQRTSQGYPDVMLPAVTSAFDPSTFQPGPPSTSFSLTGMGTMNAPSASGLPCPHQQSLTSLLTDVNAMRNLITCQICHNLMYEPFSLACGHTYCYSCLSQWLGHNKSCPDCRTRATQQPVPSYLVREMVLIFISRTQLLPDGETSEEHVKNAREEAGLVYLRLRSLDLSTWSSLDLF
nr:putative ring finger protein [Quercus suber]